MGDVEKREKLYMNEVTAYMGNFYIVHSICCKSKIALRNKVKFIKRKGKKHLLIFSVNIWTYWHG